MVDYPDLSSLNNGSGIAGLMSLPNSSYPYFWAWIFAGIWAIMVMTMYFKEKAETGKGKILSSMAVSSFAIIFLATIGSIFSIVPGEIMVSMLVMGLIIIGVWFLSSK